MHSNGVIAGLWVKRAHRGPMDPAESVRLVAGRGIEGNADQGRRRQVTLIAEEAWNEMMDEMSADVDPSARRANILLRGVDLAYTRGRVLRLGGCRLRIAGETRPCERIDEALPGLRHAMDPYWRGGVFAEVLDDGTVAIGDPVEWVDEPVTETEDRPSHHEDRASART